MVTENAQTRWGWVAATCRGHCHDVDGSASQDQGAVFELTSRSGSRHLLLAVADGAGSAAYGGQGARIAVRVLISQAARYLFGGMTLNSLSDKVISNWINEIRTKIEKAASKRQSTTRSFATTLIGTLLSNDVCIVIQIGDGACVFQKSNEDKWQVPIWPMNGEYVNETYFVTDFPSPRLSIFRVDACVQRVALLTDGIQHLVLHERSQTAHMPFFESIFDPLRKIESPGRHRSLSRALANYLESDKVGKYSHDDKTLILAQRICQPTGD